jgi:hypothetical protein
MSVPGNAFAYMKIPQIYIGTLTKSRLGHVRKPLKSRLRTCSVR